MIFQLIGGWPVQGGAVLVPSDTVIDATPTVRARGAGYAINDSVTLTNGVVLIVAAVFQDGVSEWSVAYPAQMARPVTAGPVAQAKTSGSGVGATAIFANWNGVPLPMPMPLNAKCLDQEAYDAMIAWHEPQSDQLVRLIQYSPNVKPKGASNG